MEVLINIGGGYNLVLVVFHLAFWRIFNWKDELRTLGFLNRAIMPVLNISLTFVFIIFAYISLVHARDLLNTELGHSLLILMAVFWWLRTLLQPLFFKLRHWGSLAFMLFFAAGGILYSLPAISVL